MLNFIKNNRVLFVSIVVVIIVIIILSSLFLISTLNKKDDDQFGMDNKTQAAFDLIYERVYDFEFPSTVRVLNGHYGEFSDGDEFVACVISRLREGEKSSIDLVIFTYEYTIFAKTFYSESSDEYGDLLEIAEDVNINYNVINEKLAYEFS